MVLKYYSYIFNQVVICGNRGLEASRHLWRSWIRGESSFVVFDVERVKVTDLKCHFYHTHYSQIRYEHTCKAQKYIEPDLDKFIGRKVALAEVNKKQNCA